MAVTTRLSGDLSRSLLPVQYMESRKFGIGPDFLVYTGGMQPVGSNDLPEADAGRPIVRMRGSSTIQDLQGDNMLLSALEDMTKVSPELLLWLNHSYDLPQDLFGRLYQLPTIQIQASIADLWLSAEAVLSNPLAEKTYNYIVKDRVRLGCSVGCQVTDYEFVDPEDFFSPLVIKHVTVLEWSVVSIPANQRCWVEQAVKGLFARSLVEGNGDAALKLAPAFKGFYTQDFRSVVENLTSDGLAKDLRQIRTRNTTSQRIMFDFGNENFYLEAKDMKKSLTREETSTLLEKATPVTPEPVTEPEPEPEEVDEDVLDITKTASGKTSWPLMDIGTEWTGSKAEKQIFDWAKNDDGEIQASKAKQCFLYTDTENTDKQSGYKLPFVFVDGSPKIVPLGVRAVAGSLSGARGGGDFGGDDAAIKGKVKTLYGRINSQFNPDPKWEVPWEKDEKGEEPEVTKEIADSESDAPLNRQDLGEVTIKADGSHEAFTGTHSHSHSAHGSQGSDETHSHEHSHDGDANHSHSHAEEKQGEPEVTKELVVNEVGEPIGEHVTATIEGFVPTLTTPGEITVTYSNAESEEKSVEPATVKQGEVVVPSPEQVALLGVYNSIGKQLGFPDHALTTKCDLVATEGDAGIVRATLSALDDCSDAMIELASKTDGYVDALMGMMGVPDTNDMDTSDGYAEAGEAAVDSSPLNPFPGMASHTPGTRKEGRELSGSNKKKLQAIHDTVAAMHPDACHGDGTAHQDGSTTVEEAQEEARQMGQGDAYTNLASLMGETMRTALFKSLEGINAKELVEGTVQKAVDAAVQDARDNLELLQREQMVLMNHISKLSNMPLGRPTTLQRTVTPTSPHALDNVTNYQELLTAGGAVEEQDLASLTQIVTRGMQTVNGEIQTKMRYWPAGVGKGIRPALTATQKSMMHMSDWERYREGDEVYVPVVDDPFLG